MSTIEALLWISPAILLFGGSAALDAWAKWNDRKAFVAAGGCPKRLKALMRLHRANTNVEIAKEEVDDPNEPVI